MFHCSFIIIVLLILFDSSLCLHNLPEYSILHHRREELVISNIFSDPSFSLDFNATNWKVALIEKTSFLVGVSNKKILITSIDANSSISKNSSVLEFENGIIDFAIFEHWNNTYNKPEPIIVIAHSNTKLSWYRFENLTATQFWSWQINKNITHINQFSLNNNKHLLLITKNHNQFTCDIYEFAIKKISNFWLSQNIPLKENVKTTGINNYGPDYFLSVPQKFTNYLFIYKYFNNKFVAYKNISSQRVENVASFDIGPNSFLAFSGAHAGIYKFTRNGVAEVRIAESHFEGMQHWLPIPINSFGNEIVLIAQRTVEHGLHHSFVLEIITYNGLEFEEHEDISCNYLGENYENLACLSENDKNGIVGAAPIQLGENIGLIIPRDHHPSELFVFNMTLRKISNPFERKIEEFKDHRKRLDEILHEQQEEFMKLRESFIEDDIEDFSDKIDQLQEKVEALKKKLEEIHTFENQPTYKTVIFSDIVEVDGLAKVDFIQTEKIDGEPANEILEDIVRRDSPKIISGTKIFSDYEINDVAVEKINNVNADDLVFKNNDSVKINGSIRFHEEVTADSIIAEKVNGTIFEEEIVRFDRPFKVNLDNVEVLNNLEVEQINGVSAKIMHRTTRSAEKVKDIENQVVPFLYVPGNVTVKNLNGQNLNVFLRELCLTNLETFIPELTVLGDVTVVENSSVHFINNLKYPEDFVFRDASTVRITGTKTFTDTLEADNLKCNGLINGIDPDEVITLNSDQEIPGQPLFRNISITESFQLDGNVSGEYVDKFLRNPNMMETDFITSRVNFKSLEVDGPIIVEDNYNGKNIEKILDNIIYEDDKEAVITGHKQFLEGFTVHGNLNISSKMINKVPIDTLITKNTVQELNFNILNGTVTFENLLITGLYDGIDVKKLDDETVKLNGTQYVGSTLIFKENVEVDNLEIRDTINSLKPNDVMYINNNNQEAENTIKFDNITVGNLYVFGNITGEIEDFDLEEFDKTHLSFTKDQTIKANYNIKKSEIDIIKIQQINDMDSSELFNENVIKSKIMERLSNGNIKIKNLYVNGSLDVEKINNEDPMNLGGELFKQGLRKLKTLYFNDNVHFKTLQITNLSNANFNELVENTVFKNETSPMLGGQKLFIDEITVEKLIETEEINDIRIGNILTKHGSSRVRGPINFNGGVVFEDDVTVDELNGVSTEYIKQNYQATQFGYRITGETMFTRSPQINNLRVNGFYEDKKVQDILDSIVFVDQNTELKYNMTFKNKVNFEGGFKYNTINGVDLPEFLSNIVLLDKDPEINSPVRFKSPIKAEKMELVDKMESRLINGIDLKTWIERAIFTDEGLLKGNYSFEDVEVVNNLQTEFLNDINTKDLILLKSDQNISHLSIKEVTSMNNITVDGFVNNLYLPDEYINTLTTDSNQEIISNLIFTGNITSNNLTIRSTLNKNDINKIVTIDTDQNLTAFYNFKSRQTFEKDLIIDGLINDVINLTKWRMDGLKIASPQQQTIRGDWNISQDLIFEKDVDGEVLINGVNLQRFAQLLADKNQRIFEMEKDLIENYAALCGRIEYLHGKLKKQIYKFDYLERLQSFEFEKPVNYVYNFKLNDMNFLLINEENDCNSHLLYWNNTHYQFIGDKEMGQIEQIISVPSDNHVSLIVRNKRDNFCGAKYTNIWYFDKNAEPKHILNMENVELLQESLVPKTFYAVKGGIVTEYKVDLFVYPFLYKVRKWELFEDNMVFVPRGIVAGLTLTTGSKILRLNRKDKFIDPTVNTEFINNSSFIKKFNPYLPGRDGSSMEVFQIGVKENKKSLLAMSSFDDSSVENSVDFIKIFDNPLNGRVYQKIPTFRPSAPVSFNFNNGETLLVFMENQHILRLYEYKGIEGFKQRYSIKTLGTKLFTITVPTNDGNKKYILGIIHGNRINLIDVVMLGNQILNSFYCSL